SREIGGRSLRCDTESGEGDAGEQKTLHDIPQFQCASLSCGKRSPQKNDIDAQTQDTNAGEK
ncbi:MAG TPA: hypothetical protein VEN78_16335, partial [Bradyrhizobium sp.]|nr:hypothetical protein [Bradyrhizobium sp.]